MSNSYKLVLILLMYFASFSMTNAQSTLRFELSGIQNEVLINVQKSLSLLKESYGELNAEKIKAIYKEAPLEIRTAMQPYGYFRVQIKANASKQKDAWIAHFIIHPNSEIRISQI